VQARRVLGRTVAMTMAGRGTGRAPVVPREARGRREASVMTGVGSDWVSGLELMVEA
jgi:hypothetical protein